MPIPDRSSWQTDSETAKETTKRHHNVNRRTWFRTKGDMATAVCSESFESHSSHSGGVWEGGNWHCSLTPSWKGLHCSSCVKCQPHMWWTCPQSTSMPCACVGEHSWRMTDTRTVFLTNKCQTSEGVDHSRNGQSKAHSFCFSRKLNHTRAAQEWMRFPQDLVSNQALWSDDCVDTKTSYLFGAHQQPNQIAKLVGTTPSECNSVKSPDASPGRRFALVRRSTCEANSTSST